nr:uncharacterized protein LOC111501890 [Leptinotarsa decemlineata]
MNLRALASFTLALIGAVLGQIYDYPLDPGVIYPQLTSVPFPFLELEPNSIIGLHNSQSFGENVDFSVDHSFPDEKIPPSSTGKPVGGPEKISLDPLYHGIKDDNQKQYHFFVAQEEPKTPEIKPIPPPPVRTKIIFIKAPSPPKTKIVVTPPRQEKTIIYVLVKKPEEPEIQISPATTQSPEVYFIRYKTRKGSPGSDPNKEEPSEDDSQEEDEAFFNSKRALRIKKSHKS